MLVRAWVRSERIFAMWLRAARYKCSRLAYTSRTPNQAVWSRCVSRELCAGEVRLVPAAAAGSPDSEIFQHLWVSQRNSSWARDRGIPDSWLNVAERAHQQAGSPTLVDIALLPRVAPGVWQVVSANPRAPAARRGQPSGGGRGDHYSGCNLTGRASGYRAELEAQLPAIRSECAKRTKERRKLCEWTSTMAWWRRHRAKTAASRRLENGGDVF
jgi:hypothetical protein